MISMKSQFHKMFLLCLVLILQVFSTVDVYARDVTLSGKVINFSSSDVNPVVRVYLPGLPYYEMSNSEWRFLGEAAYSKTTGDYSVVVDVPDNENNLVLSVSYLSPDTDVISWVNVASSNQAVTDINLPVTKNTDLSFKVVILISGNEFNYIDNSASCMIISKAVSGEGRLMLLGVYDAWVHKFTAYGLPAGEYRMACSIQNASGITVGNQVPSVLKRYKDFTLPITNQEKIINFDFSETSTDGSVY